MVIQVNNGNLTRSQLEKELQAQRREAKKGKAPQKNGSVINARDLGLQQDNIFMKKQQAQKKAMKVVGDTFKADKQLDQSIADSRKHLAELEEQINGLQDEVDAIDVRKEELRESLGVSEDSQEHKDLELMIKQKNMSRPDSNVVFTDEERARLKELEGMPKTEYQTRALEMEDSKEPFLRELDEAKKMVRQEQGSIKGIKKMKLESSPMVKAEKEKKSILDAASKEVVGMLIDEAKDHIDEEAKENIEKAEEEAEKKETEEELREAIKEKTEENEEPDEVQKPSEVENIVQLDSNKNSVQQEVKKIIDELKLLEEDLKGAAVDQGV